MVKLYLFTVILCNFFDFSDFHIFKGTWTPYDSKYGQFSEKERLETLDSVKEMFYFGYENYMKHAFPLDELNPIYCSGRGPDYANPSNINVNDALGDYILTLVDTLDTLAIMGNSSEFKRAVSLVIENLSFDKPNTVQVFEATIRVLGGLLSAHLIIMDKEQPFGDVKPDQYDGDLLSLSHDLAVRLLNAFDNTATGLPYPRVNLRDGVPPDCTNETCTAGAGTLVLEFGILSRLLADPMYENVARKAVLRLWEYRSNVTGLLGSVINIQTGEWVNQMSGVGAGMDSFYEYLLKSYILFGDENDLRMFNETYESIKFHMRRGRLKCNAGVGNTPIFVNVNMRTGDIANYWIDALQAAWPALQVLNGDIDEAICSHAIYYSIWRKYEAMPERYNWHLREPEVLFYPLRPELVESTYFLYRATKNPFYLHVGRDILNSINQHAKAKCGYGTVHDVHTKELEDRMESFFLSETCKYLYLLFDKDNHLNKMAANYIFSTEGHIFPIDGRFREKAPDDFIEYQDDPDEDDVVVDVRTNVTLCNCDSIPKKKSYLLPMESHYFEQIDMAIGVDGMS